MSRIVHIDGLNKADVLAVLYNASRPLGYGFLHYDPTPMIREFAQFIIDQQRADRGDNRLCFDYLIGRVMKVDLTSDDEFDPREYDNYNGQGAAERAIDLLRIIEEPDNDAIRAIHKNGLLDAAIYTLEHLGDKSHTTQENGITVLHVGLGDAPNELSLAVAKAMENRPDGPRDV